MIPDATGIPALDAVLVWGGALVALGAIVTGLWRGTAAVVRFFRRVTQFIDDYFGEEARPGVPARPGLMERMGGMEERLGAVYHEVFPNDGGSLRDAVDQANRRLRLMCPDCDHDQAGGDEG
ncbi:hypothetical protein PV341_07705 [Streptomyces sp. PA03-1a]|nr:hypothetical protein [Streptomyces sp. PA03-1a]